MIADHAPDDRRLQPWLHDLVVALAAPTQAWCGPDGQVRASGAQGFYHGDVRVLSRAVLTLDEVEPVSVLVSPDGATAVLAVGVARLLGDTGPDPTVRVQRRRVVAPGRVDEVIVLESSARAALATRVRLALEVDLAPIDRVKSGEPVAPVPPTP
ncbi:MAG TPA: glycogen debranching N-terminal domain-containing protein, partial [Actinomycetales bacterium]|nr:glycogen debranching N-terminal domain-containing protein [Actinomycetales bacterium]